MQRDLARELGADGTSGARDENRAPGNLLGELRELELDGLPTEQVFDPHLPQLVEMRVSAEHFGDPGEDLEGNVRALATLHDLSQLLGSGAGNGDHDLVRNQRRGHRGDVVDRTHHLYSVSHRPPLEGVVVHERDRLISDGRTEHFVNEHLPRLTRAHHERALDRARTPVVLDAFEQDAVRQPNRCGEITAQYPLQEHDGARDPGQER